MNSKDLHSIYFVGIGGIGMSALARYFMSKGIAVSGYDLTCSPLTKQLEQEGASIHYYDAPELIPANLDFAVYTPAVPQTLNEMAELRQKGVKLLKRAEALGIISHSHHTIAVAGTHGKTTTTAMLSHIAKHSGTDTTAFIGGIANNIGSNITLGSSNSLLVVEADEYDRSFLQLSPNISIITSIDADHLDIYGNIEQLHESFNTFAAQTQDVVICHESISLNGINNMKTYGIGAHDYAISDVGYSNGLCTFNIEHHGHITHIYLPCYGLHNVMNATAAFAAAYEYGIEENSIVEALACYKGVKRRLDVRVNTPQHTYIDDYAHHPEEIRASITAIRSAFPDRKMTIIFQPHLFSRTRDFLDDFAEALSLADNVILLEIYPAREKPIEGINSSLLLDKIKIANKQLCKNETLLDTLRELKPELLLTMGAGNIDRFVEPIEKMMKTW